MAKTMSKAEAEAWVKELFLFILILLLGEAVSEVSAFQSNHGFEEKATKRQILAAMHVSVIGSSVWEPKFLR